MTLRIAPITLRQAAAFVQEHHRHHGAPQGALWALALLHGDELVGVAICGRPVSRMLAGYLEVTRVCVLPGVKNGCSMLYGRARAISRLFGYQGILTYTLERESGVSLRAAGYVAEELTSGGTWSRPSRARRDNAPLDRKVRWRG